MNTCSVENFSLEVPKAVREEIEDIVCTASSIEVVDVETFNLAMGYLPRIKEKMKVVTDFFKPLKEAANRTHKLITATEKEKLSPLVNLDRLIRDNCTDFKNEQDRIHAELQRKAEEKARAEAEKEAAKLRKKAEKVKDEELREELKMQAEEVVVKPVFVAPVIENKTATASFVKDVVVEVTDVKEICAAIGRGDIPITIVDFKALKLKQWVKAMGIKPNQIKGLMVRETQVARVR